MARAKSPEAIVGYRSTKYGILCYGLMLKRPFSSKECVACLPGIFKMQEKRKIECFRYAAKTLERYGYLDYLGNDMWATNQRSAGVVSAAVKRYRDNCSRLLGVNYMAGVRERLAKASNSVWSPVGKDTEDAILDEVARKMRAILDKKSSREKNSRIEAKG